MDREMHASVLSTAVTSTFNVLTNCSSVMLLYKVTLLFYLQMHHGCPATIIHFLLSCGNGILYAFLVKKKYCLELHVDSIWKMKYISKKQAVVTRL